MRLLIVSPHFPPSNAADMQRVRLLLPHLAAAGIEAEVLAVEPAQVASPVDGWLEEGLPSEVPVHRVQALGLEWSKIPGLGTLSFRALGAIRSKGDELLARKAESGKLKAESGALQSRFDLIYFSTTQFGLHVLGPRWKKKFGVPFVMDYQDPWVSDYYREHPEVVPPGGRLKYAIADWLNRRQEPRVLRECSGITSVSAAYPEQLQARYPWLEIEEVFTAKAQSAPRDAEGRSDKNGDGYSETASRFQLSAFSSQLFSLVTPFPGDALDLARVKQDDIRQSVFDPNDGLKHWVYVGRGGADMATSVRAIFAAIAAQKAESGKLKAEIKRVKMHFIGTSYAAAGRGVKTIEPLAVEYGLQPIVVEHPDRIPYSETLRCLLDADALIVPGSDDPGYTASKIYPYLLAGKPLLAVFHDQSSVVSLIRAVGGATVVPFASNETVDAIAGRIASDWLASDGPEVPVPLDEEAFAPYTARNQAGQLAKFFKNVLNGSD